jgi:hypothetical protein
MGKGINGQGSVVVWVGGSKGWKKLMMFAIWAACRGIGGWCLDMMSVVFSFLLERHKPLFCCFLHGSCVMVSRLQVNF